MATVAAGAAPQKKKKERYKPKGIAGLIYALQNVKIGGGTGDEAFKVPRKDLTFILSNLATLVQNGVSLRKAIYTLAQEQSLFKYHDMLDTMLHKLEAGESFSSALAKYPATFNDLMVHQIRVGEKSGTVPETLTRIVEQVEKGNKIRTLVIKRLSYPAIVTCAGVGVIIFMMLFIVPVFQKTYADAKVPLPFITQVLINSSEFLFTYGWIIPVLVVGGVFGIKKLRKRDSVALRMDTMLLRIPMVGSWLRDIAVMQFMDVMCTMMESGFRVVEALGASKKSIGNRAVRTAVSDLRDAVLRGERFSREIDRHEELFPPVVSQLVIVGEQTGRLGATTGHIRSFLEEQIERKTEIAVGTIEPVMTIGMAAAIGVILLAVYLPMFDMISVVNN